MGTFQQQIDMTAVGGFYIGPSPKIPEFGNVEDVLKNGPNLVLGILNVLSYLPMFLWIEIYV